MRTITKMRLFASFGILLLIPNFIITTADENDQTISFIEEKSRYYGRVHGSKVRIPRDPSKKIDKLENNSKIKQQLRSELVLVKKPIPKYDDKDSEEDYQIKVRNPNKYSDSVEHEDEDFNLDDYDFDIHHDEFAGRGKPLQPRMKIKLNSKRIDRKKEKKSTPKSNYSKITLVSKPSNKVVRKAKEFKKDTIYRDENFIATREPETCGRSLKLASEDNFDDISSENGDSKEYIGRSPVRAARSPLSFNTYIEKLGEKTNLIVMKILGYLPMFPQMPPPTKQ